MIHAPSVGAVAPENLFRIPEDQVAPGSGASELRNPRDLAGSPVNGHVFVTEYENSRISEYTPWGVFVKAWGWNVSPEGAPGDTAIDELEICTSVCQAGTPGEGSGQLRGPTGITLDASGNVYVYDWENFRVQKFSTSGDFLLMFGGGVNATEVAEGGSSAEQNLCTAASEDTCQAGVAGSDDGYLSGALGNYISYRSTSNTILVGDEGEIQEFDVDGSLKGHIDMPGKTIRSLDVDSTGSIYFAAAEEPNIHKLSPAGMPESPEFIGVNDPGAIAVDAGGNVYAVEVLGGGSQGSYVLGFDSSGTPIEGMEHPDRFARPEFPGPGNLANDLVGLATNLLGPGSSELGGLYVVRFTINSFSPPARSYVSVYGQPPVRFESPPARPPVIDDQYATAVGTGSAVLKAQINPRFWADTTYYVEYGTSPCATRGCKNSQPSAPGFQLTQRVVNAPLTTSGVALENLESGTTYYYRFVANSGGGGPVVGEEKTFRTFPDAGDVARCDNDRLRPGPSMSLPDCRAHELVSPVEKSNGDVIVGFNVSGYRETFFQSATSGSRLAFASGTAFGELPPSAPFSAQYIATRSDNGWLSQQISPPRERLVVVGGAVLEGEFKAFSDDLCQAWLRTVAEPVLATGAVAGFPNLYRRQNCGPVIYDSLTLSSPDPGIEPSDYRRLELQGVSEDGATAIYVAPDDLTLDAPSNTNKRPQLYRHSEGQVNFICILPGGVPTSKPCNAGGSGDEFGEGRLGNFQHAVSTNGQRVFWTESDANAGPGRIFLRVEGESSSRPVSGVVSSAKARFWAAAADGSKAIFTIDDSTSSLNRNLYRFDVGSEKAELIAEDALGLLGASGDATQVYFASTGVLTGDDENSAGDRAVSGAANLYVAANGSDITFIGTLSQADTTGLIDGTTPSSIAKVPVNRTARVSPDGRHAVFMSTASLTGFDSSDANQGVPTTEVFLYDAEESLLRCVSCNPSGARPDGEPLLTVKQPFPTGIWAAAKIPAWERALYASRVLSDDGNRVFFESADALTPGDSNGVQDVYQWEAEGTGSCAADDAGFAPDSGGCIHLISSGKSERASSFVDADPSGNNVFFTTLDSLVEQDYGLVDVYDARVGGGFPPPTPPVVPCRGEACQPLPSVPPAAANSTSSPGPGNPRGRRPCRPAGKKAKRGKASRRGKRCHRARKHAKRHRRASG